MPSIRQRQIIYGVLLGAMGLSAVIFIIGLSLTLPLGDANRHGFLLVPALPTPLYIVMGLVVLAGVGLTLLVSFIQRRKPSSERPRRRQAEHIKTPWQLMVSTLASCTILVLAVLWFMRYGTPLFEWLEQWRHDLRTAPELLAAGTQSLLRQVDSPITGYAMFITVLVIYGGLAILALWVLYDGRQPVIADSEPEDPRSKRVRRAVTAGLRELRQHADPRQSIIACYARLEHLLEDYGVPTYNHLTPQEYMGAAMQGVDVPLDAFAGLVGLFEQARYSLHPLDNVAREQAIEHLQTIKSHLEWRATLATRA
jgi:hypothetical protein